MIRIRWKDDGPTPRGMKRELNAIKKIAFEQLGIWWHTTMRPKHFTHQGAKEYGYSPRKGERGSKGGGRFRSSYTGRKLRKFGHTLPLVYTGESRALTRIRNVRATSTGVRVIMRAPTLNRQNRNSQVNMREELTRVSIREHNELDRLMGRIMERRLQAVRTGGVRRLA